MKTIIIGFLFISQIIIAQNSPVLIAHRGASSLAPENTMASFISAIDMNVDFIELDVQKSSDDSLMIIHDASVDRTTNYVGNVNTFSYSQLKTMDAGSHFSSSFVGEQIPSLFEVLSYAKGKIKICVELKANAIEYQAINMIQNLNLENDVIIFSFDINQLQTIKNLDPSIKVCFLQSVITQANITTLLNIGGEYVGSGGAPGLSAILFAQNVGVNFWMWTLNDTDDMQYRMSQGIDGIITDFPQDYFCLKTLFENSGLVAHWDFDEGSGNSLIDVTGNNNNGVINNSSYIAGKDSTCLSFNGTSSYVILPQSNSLDVSGDAVSISAWVNLNQLPSAMISSYGPIYDSDQDSYILYLDKANAELRFKVKDVSGDIERPGIPESSLNTGTWHHIAGVYNGHNVMIYLNGYLIDYHSNSDLDDLQIGQIAEIGRNNGSYFSGKLDEIKIYNRALFPNEVKNLFNENYNLCLDTSIIEVYLDSLGISVSNNINACDSVNINITQNNSFLSVFNFEGITDYININSNSAEIANSSHSFFSWIKTTNLIADERIFSINTLNGGNISLFGVYNGKLDIYNGAYHTANSYINDGLWHFVGYTWNISTNNLSFWIDGVHDASFSNVNLTSSNTDLISLGQEFDSWKASNKFSGQMSNITIWKKELNPSEIQNIYANTPNSNNSNFIDLIAHYNTTSACNSTLKDNSAYNNDGISYVPIKITYDTISGYNNSNKTNTWEYNNSVIDSSILNLTISNSENITYSQTDNFGVIYLDSFQINIYQSPQINLGQDTILCVGDLFVLDAGANYSSYLWSDNSNNQTYDINTNNLNVGNYDISVIVNDSNNCVGYDTVSVVIDLCLNLDEYNSSVIIYPNPSTYEIKIKYSNYYTNIKSNIFDNTGKFMFSSNKDIIDVNYLTKGIYFIEIYIDDKRYIERFTK
jgi:glycerophosphoryl diester phosphodiesterase